MVYKLVGKEYVVIHTVGEEYREANHKQQLTAERTGEKWWLVGELQNRNKYIKTTTPDCTETKTHSTTGKIHTPAQKSLPSTCR